MKKTISLLITICMICTLLAAYVWADAPEAGESAAEAGESAAEGGDSATAEGESEGDSEGDSAGGDSAAVGADANATDTTTVDLMPEYLDELIIGPEGYEFTTDVFTGKLELDPAAVISCKYPIIVHFEESDTVENGTVIGNVQFLSDYDEIIAIIHTNDVHGHIEVDPYVKGLADQLKESGEYSLVLSVSAGDIYGGGEAVASSYNGEFIPAVMDPVYDIIVPGNNDFVSSGSARQDILLTGLYNHALTLCANAVTKDDGLAMGEYADNYESVIGNGLLADLYDNVNINENGSLDLSQLELNDLPGNVSPYQKTTTVTTSNGTVVGIFGLTASSGAIVNELNGLGTIASAQESVESLLAEGADVIVGVGHTGWTGEGSTGATANDTNSWQVGDQVNDLDVYVDGHSHSIINEGQGVLAGSDPTFINQAESFGYCIGVIYLYVKDGKVLAADGNIIRDMEDITPDPDVQAMVDMALARVKEDYGKAIAHTDYFLNGERLSAGNPGGTVRGNETNLGDFMTDIFLAAASERTGTNYDFSTIAGYWLRSSIEEGDITLESLQKVFANETVIYYAAYTGAQILSMVQAGLQNVAPEKEENTFRQYSGIEITYIDNNGTGTPVTIKVGDTLVYDADNGGLQVDDSWTAEGVIGMTGPEIDSYTGDQENWICHNKEEVQQLVADWLLNHTADEYTIYPNEVAPNGRIVPVES